MRWLLKSRRSGGIRVTRGTYRYIARGDAARAAGDWHDAVAYYRRAVAAESGLGHIYIQLGHALKELSRLDEAGAAYRAALAINRDDREPWLYVGEVARRCGAYREASIAFATMLTFDIEDGQAAEELARTLRYLGASERDAAIAMLQDHLPAILTTGEAVGRGTGTDATATVAFDVSDLINFFGHARRPTGIQRVQIETVSAALADHHDGVRIILCCMSESSDRWHALSPSLFHSLISLSNSMEAGEVEWRRLRSTLRLALLLAPVLAFPAGTALVNLGASWWLGNYFLALRDARSRRPLAYLPFVHDLIPIFHPEYHVQTLIEEFVNWLVPAIGHADHFLVNSRATSRDLTRARMLIGDRASGRETTVIPLDATFADARRSHSETAVLPVEQPFVLFVGTIEPRKGHAAAFDAWSLLLQMGGTVPLLVCVGRPGWHHELITARLNDATLRAHILILSDLSDAALETLYRDALFTLYPSRYEGWGLPVTEALSRGKVVVTTNASALPEAGGDLALYVPPDDPVALAATVRKLLDEPDRLAEREARIVAECRLRSWQAIAGQIVEVATRAVRDLPAKRPPFAPDIPVGQFHSLARLPAGLPPSGLYSGEAARTGMGWQWPEHWGCRLRAEGSAGLAFRPTGADAAERLASVVLLAIRGVAGRECEWQVTSSHGGTSRGTIGAFERAWIVVSAELDADGIVRLNLASMVSVEICDTASGTGASGFVGDAMGIEGFAFVGEEDEDGILAVKAQAVAGIRLGAGGGDG